MIETLRPLDLAACWGSDLVSESISLGTLSLFGPRGLRVGPSHVALMFEHPTGRILWGESTTLCEHICQIQHTHTRGVQAHEPADRVRDYLDAGGRVDLYRLRFGEELTREQSAHLSRVFMDGWIGRQYDTSGALLSGTRIFRRSRLFPRMDPESVFCSALAARLLMMLSKLNRGNARNWNPARLLRRLVRTDTYRRVGTLAVDPLRIVVDGTPTLSIYR